MTRTRLYLDIDGVLNAVGSSSTNGTEWNCRPKLFHANGFKMRVAMPMVHSLEKLIEDFDLELVWLTTWLCDGDVETAFLPQLGALGGGRLLNYPEGVGGPETWPDFHDWKWKELLRDQTESPSDFIWIDDDEVPIYCDMALTLRAQADEFGGAMTIAPLPYKGITHEHLRTMRKFLEERANV